MKVQVETQNASILKRKTTYLDKEDEVISQLAG